MSAGLLFAVLACATLPPGKDEAFSFAVEAVSKDHYVAGANASWTFLAGADPDDPRYDRGLRLVALSAEGLDLRFAAGMIYRQIAQARRSEALLPDAIAGIERIVAAGGHDEDTLLVSFVDSEEFGTLPADVQAFVDFQQGLDLARRGSDDWSEVHFARLPVGSPYAARAEYVRAVRQVADGDYAAADARLLALARDASIPGDLAADATRTRARLAFEERRFENALRLYETLREQAPDDPEILLEMAWTEYYLGDSRKALGLLTALDAPVHQDFISPERYLLEALALRRLCQFGAARQAAVRLQTRYAGSLAALGSGTLPADIPELAEAARLRGGSKQTGRLLRRLETERAVAADLPLDPDLSAWLDDLYRRGLEEVQRREDAQLGADVDALTEELLASNEGVQLIVHELSVSMLRGRRRPPGVDERPPVEIPLSGELVFFPFAGEFWTDEMDDLLVVAEDRCID